MLSFNRTPLWLQRRRSADLLKIARNYPSFPIVLETYREVLQEHFDLPALTELLSDVRARKVRVTDVSLDTPSPFASSLTFDFIAEAELIEEDLVFSLELIVLKIIFERQVELALFNHVADIVAGIG